MPFPDDLFPCTYRGALFYLSDANTSGGRKTSKKEIINSDRQVVEDLGLAKRAFTLSGTIAARRAADGTEILSYEEVKRALLDALELGGVGILVHPFFGRIENVQVTTWTLNERMTSLGASSISINFEISDTDGVPRSTPAVLGEVETNASAASASLEEAVADDLKATPKFQGNFEDAIDKVEAVADAIEAAVDFTETVAGALNQFASDVAELGSDAASLVAAPQSLAESVRNVVSSINGVLATPTAVFNSMKRLFDFGDLDIRFTADDATAGGRERQRNRDLLNSQVQGQALAQAYVAAAQLDLPDVSAIDDTQAILEAQFQKMVAAAAWDSDGQEAITKTRIALTAFFDAQRATKPRRTTVRIPAPTPARVLAYRYYEDSTRGDQIAELNDLDDSAFVDGDVEILTS